MANMVNYNLQGPGITVRYGNGELSFATDDQGGWSARVGEVLQGVTDRSLTTTTTTTENGISINAVLLASDRAGVGFTLSLLLPEVDFPPQETNADVTGVAIITQQYRNRVGARGLGVLQFYEVRALSGTATLAADTASV